LEPVDMGDGLSVTVLGPTQTRLRALKPQWRDEVAAAINRGALQEAPPDLEALGASRPPLLRNHTDLTRLALSPTPADTSKANASSIILLLEWENRRILLTGDAFADDVRDGLVGLGPNQPVALDLFKVPHHGSKQNMTRALVEAVECPLWVFSSDGTRYCHPDAEAVARILHFGRHREPTLAFNVRKEYSGWWDNDNWRNLFGYQVCYGSDEDGLTIRFDSG
jgi:hypothetical protein